MRLAGAAGQARQEAAASLPAFAALVAPTTPTDSTVSDAVRAAVSEWEIRRLAEAGVLERRYIGESRRSYRITAASLDRYIDDLPDAPLTT